MPADNVRLNLARNDEGELIRSDVDSNGAQWQYVKTAYGADGDQIEVTEERALPVRLNGPLTAFGELAIAEYTPIIQIDAVYGLRTTDVDQLTDTGSSGTNSSSDHLFVCSSGTANGGYASIRSARGFRYRPGQAGMVRFTALFDTVNAAADNVQRAGFLCHEGSIGFGYNGTAYGVYRQTDGKTTIQTLTVDTAATGGENATITLNGTAHTVALTAGTKAHNAYEIGAFAYTLGWKAKQNGDTVVFLLPKTGLTAGSFTFSSATAAATLVEDQAGVVDVYDWIPQASWSHDTMDGTGPSGMTIDPAMGNVYVAEFQYLGFGAIQFWVENSVSGCFQLVHRIEYANANTVPSLPNPTMRVGWMSESFGSTTDVTVKGACAAAFVGGKFVVGRAPRGDKNDVAAVGTTFENVVAIRVRSTFHGQLHLGEVFPSAMHVAVDGTKPAEASLFINPTFTGETDWSYVDEDASIVEVMKSAVTVAVGSGRELPAGSMSRQGSADEHLSPLSVRLEPGDVLCLAVRATSGTTDTTGSIIWVED